MTAQAAIQACYRIFEANIKIVPQMTSNSASIASHSLPYLGGRLRGHDEELAGAKHVTTQLSSNT